MKKRKIDRWLLLIAALVLITAAKSAYEGSYGMAFAGFALAIVNSACAIGRRQREVPNVSA